MAQIIAYLTFNGNCREAMLFYQHCMGGKLCLQTVEESPMSGKMPERMKENILHASLVSDQFVLMGSDMCGTDELLQGNSVALIYQCKNEQELHYLYSQLYCYSPCNTYFNFSNTITPIEVLDKFGVFWLLHLTEHSTL